MVPFGHALESMSCSHQTFFSKVWPNELHNSRYTGVSLARWHGDCRIACHRECVGETMQIVDHVIRNIRALLPRWQAGQMINSVSVFCSRESPQCGRLSALQREPKSPLGS